MFREQAIRSGLYQQEPLPRIHRNYYDKYIRMTQGTPLPSERVGGAYGTNGGGGAPERFSSSTSHTLSLVDRARSRLRSSNSKRLDTYIPLRDLLRHNHEERVQGYLKQLNEEEE
jgi:hypothetical protein